MRDRSSGIEAKAATGGGDERTPVSGGVALWLAAEAREVVAVRCRSGEGEIAAWGWENFGWQRWGALFKGGQWEEESEGESVGVGRHGQHVEDAGHKKGGPCPPASGARQAAARNQRACMTCTVRALLAEQRGRREADGWATATVPGGGAADEQGPSGSERGREDRGTDRRDRPVSGRGRWGGCGLRGACVGAREPAQEGKGGPSRDE
jgi:hypothetical protein